MKLKPIPKYKLKFPKRIVNIFPINELTLISGLPGTGKSFSLLTFLNKHSIEPILFNLDCDATLEKFKLKGSIHKGKILKNFIAGKYTDLDNEVVIIDTYQRAKEILKINTEKDQEKFTKRLLYLARKHKITIIVVGHPVDYVGRSSIFKDNPSLVRNCYEHLHLDKIEDKRKRPPTLTYRLYINKGRGIGGAKVIENWMRNEK